MSNKLIINSEAKPAVSRINNYPLRNGFKRKIYIGGLKTHPTMGDNQNNGMRIYLIGSYYSFRDRIIQELPQYPFSDPRTHSQSCVAKLVIDDMSEAEKCPIAFSVFPKGKRKGVMSFAEIGASVTNNNHQLIVDETEEQDPLLISIAHNFFNNLNSALSYLKTGPVFEANKKKEIIKKYPPTVEDKKIPMNTIYFCGTIDDKLLRIVEQAGKKRPDKSFIIKSGNTFADFERIMNYDLIVANFPGNLDWDRHACFMMGAAYSHDIPVLLREDKDWKYPPLQAIVRRHTPSLEGVLEYVTEVDDNHINREAVNMYNFFERELKRRNQQ